jgi:hypothetical protein
VYVFFCRMSKDFVELLDLAGDDAGERNKVCRQRDDADKVCRRRGIVVRLDSDRAHYIIKNGRIKNGKKEKKIVEKKEKNDQSVV